MSRRDDQVARPVAVTARPQSSASGETAAHGLALVIANLLLVGVSVAIALGAAEVVVRLVRPQLTYRFPRGLFVPDPVTSYGLAPGFRGELDTPEYRTRLSVNAQGLRQEREVGPKAPGVTRVVMLGDSFTMGVGVEAEETMAALLEQALAPQVEVVNAGVAGYGTRTSVAQLAARGSAWDPDMVVLAMFVGNDVADNASEPQVVQDGYLVPAGSRPPVGVGAKLQRFLNVNSQLYRFLLPFRERFGGASAAEAAARRQAFVELHGVGIPGAYWTPTWRALDAFAAWLRSARVPGAVLLIPDRVQVSPSLWSAALREVGVAEGAVAPQVPNDRLRAYCENAGLPVLDLWPVLRGEGDGAAWYFPQDHHLTADGTRTAMRAVVPFVRQVLASPRSAR